MTPMTDWHCRLLPGFCGAPSDPKQAAEALSLLAARTGLSRFCMMPEFCAATESVAAFLLRRDRAIEHLRAHLSDGIKLALGAAVLPTEALAEEKDLSRLTLPSGHLPIRLPNGDASHLELVLSRITHRRRIPILFLSFDACLLFSDEAVTERLSRIEGAAYQFNYRALEKPETCRLLRSLDERGARILFGTSVNRFERAGYYDITTPLRSGALHLRSGGLRRLLSENEHYVASWL